MALERLGYAALGSIYDAAMDSSLWVNALDAAVAAGDAQGVALLIVENDDNQPFNIRAVGGVYKSMVPAGQVDYYVKHLAHFEAPDWEVVARQRPGHPLLDSEISDIGYLDARPDYCYLRETVGISRRVGFRMNDNPAWFDAITFSFDTSIPVIPQHSIRRLGALIPHLAKAAEIGRAFSQLRARYAAVLAVLDKVHVGLAIATASGEIIVRNTEAERILSLQDGIGLGRDGRLLCDDAGRTAMLRDYVSQAARTASGEADRPESLIAAPRPSGKDPLLIEVAPLSDSAGEVDTNLVGALVTIIDPANAPPLDIDRFARLYKLTQAESAVCRHMVAGLTAAAIAERRSTSPETVKSQMKAVLTKTGTARRSQLIRLVVRTLPPIS